MRRNHYRDRTERGFKIYSQFKDFNGEDVRVQRSSAIGRRLVWIFPEAKIHMGEAVSGAHLTVAQAKRVIKALERFISGVE